MKKIILALGLALATGSGFSARAAVQIVSVNFGGPTSATLAPSDVTGAVSVGNWNNFITAAGGYRGYPGNDPITTPIALNDSGGSGSAVQLTAFTSGAGGGTGGSTGGGSPQLNLFDGGLNNNYGSATFTLAGLSSFSSYSVYVYYNAFYIGPRYATLSDGTTTFYTGGVSDYATAFTLSNDTTPFDTTDPGASGPPNSLGNYVIFSGLTADSLTITYANPNNNVDMVGFQVVGTTVPEPSTWALLGVGMIGLVMLRRRQKSV